jgi:hypothetical protein
MIQELFLAFSLKQPFAYRGAKYVVYLETPAVTRH